MGPAAGEVRPRGGRIGLRSRGRLGSVPRPPGASRVMKFGGSTYRVDQPEVVTMAEAIDDFPAEERRML